MLEVRYVFFKEVAFRLLLPKLHGGKQFQNMAEKTKQLGRH